MKLLIVKNWKILNELMYEETEIVCASEDITKLNEIKLALLQECLDEKFINEEYNINLQLDSDFYILELKVI